MKYLKARSNPSLAGINVGRALFDGIGIFIAAAANDLVIAPIVKPMVTALPKFAQKGVDAVTTGVGAVVVGHLLGMVHGELGRGVQEGGLALAGGKVVTMAVPGFQIGTTTPHSISDIFSANLAGVSAPAQIGTTATNPNSASGQNSQALAGSVSVPAGAISAPSQSGTFTDYGGRVASNQNVGL